MRRKILGIAALPLIAGTTFAVVPAAHAAPITCPDSQTAVKVGSTWTCQNSAGNNDNSENPRNPNKNKL